MHHQHITRSFGTAIKVKSQLTDAKGLGDEGKLALGADLNAKLAHLDDGTGLLAFLSALLGLALVLLDDGDTGQVIGIVPGLVLGPLLLGRHFGKICKSEITRQ